MQDEDKVKKRVKSKKRNAEKRKEKSRDAARTRRSKEADVFSELSGLIPFPTATVAALDKTSMMRLCISYLKLRKLGQGIKENLDTVLDEKIQEEYLSSINGFLVIMDRNGDMVYISENIMKHLGLSQIDLVGQNVYEYSHPCDHDEIREVLDEKHNNDSRHAKKETTFFARLKCTLTSKGRNVNLKSATFKVIRFRGHHLADSNMECWVLIGESIPHPTHMDVPLDSFSFLSRHSMDMKFSYCDSRVEDLLAYDPEDLMVKPLYEFHHALDGEYMDKMYKTLFSKGQVWTDSYRFLASGGGYAWVETQATVVYNNKTDKPQYVICIHYMISGIEEPDTIMSGVQMSLNIPSTTGVCKRIVVPTSAVQQQSSAALQQKCESPILSMKMMESIFVPKTKEMDSGICAPKRKLKEEADLEMGLIAPTAGEVISLSLDAADSDMAALLQDMLTGADIDMDLLDSKKLERPMPVNLDGLYGITANKKIDIPNLEQLIDEPSFTFSNKNEPARQQTMTMLGVIPDMEDIDMEKRAPYIPMSGEEDLVFNAIPPVHLIDEYDEGPQMMLGTTESVFSAKDDDPNEANNSAKKQIPLSLLRQEAMQQQERQYHQEMDNIQSLISQKPAMETNRLETGPPNAKKTRTMADVESDVESLPSPYSLDISAINVNNVDIHSIQGSDVLKNLLVAGVDKTAGYDVRNINRKKTSDIMVIPGESSSSRTLRGLLTGPVDIQTSLTEQSYKRQGIPDNLTLPRSGRMLTSVASAPTSTPVAYQRPDGSTVQPQTSTTQIKITTLDSNGIATGERIVHPEDLLQVLAANFSKSKILA